MAKHISGSTWMFYNQYNPDLLKYIEEIQLGKPVQVVVKELLSLHENDPVRRDVKRAKSK